MDRPEPPPEAVLLRLARKAAGIKTPDAARSARISKARLSQIENGYEHRPGGYRPVRGRDDTVAHLAEAVGVSPERLEEAGRPDAAAVLREMGRRQLDARPALVRDNWDDENVRKLWDLSVVEDQRLALIGEYLAGRESQRAI